MAVRVSRIVLVHGAAHGAWCWELVVPLLQARGYEVQTLDLPGAGEDPTPPESVTLEGYTRRVVEALNSRPTPALLVGHSMGGAPVSTATEEAPDRVARLVYLAAFLPKDGATLHSIRQWSLEAGLPPSGAVRPPVGAHAYGHAQPEQLFYHLCPPELTAQAVARLRPQPLAPFTDPLRLTARRWGAVPKTYVVCEQDRALAPALQRFMFRHAPGLRERRMDTDHSPFLSDPEGLAAILDEEAQNVGA